MQTDKPIRPSNLPGRIFLEQRHLPSLAGHVLFVGVAEYTDFYHRLVQNPEKFETIDVRESVAEHGSPYKHYIGDVREFKPESAVYDHVVCYGIMGHKDNWEIVLTEVEIREFIGALSALVKIGGTLLLAPALQTHTVIFWDGIYRELEKTYDRVFSQIMDINAIWAGRKRV